MLIAACLALPLAGCIDGDDGARGPEGPPADEGNFTMQILHFADVDGSGGLADVRNFSSLVNCL